MPVQTRAQRRAENEASKVIKEKKVTKPRSRKRRTKTYEEKSESNEPSEGTPKKKQRLRPRAKSKPKTKKSTKSQDSDHEEQKSEGMSSTESTPKQSTKRRSRAKGPGTPSKVLAECVDKLRLKNQEPVDEEKGRVIEAEENGVDAIEQRVARIEALQQRLLTQEVSGRLLGRETEFERIRSWTAERVEHREGGSFYICGSPGTGKTATMKAVLQRYARRGDVEIVKLNGMSISSPPSIFSLIHDALFGGDCALKPAAARAALERHFVPDKERSSAPMTVVVVDEMDGLLSGSRQQVLYHLFLWTQRRRSKLVLFGIANSIDLTDRFLPRLKQRQCEPEVVIFRPYSKEQLVDILRARLFGGDGGGDVFEDIAVTLCAQKVAKMYGDVRKCLELCRNALSVLLTEHRHDVEAKVGFLAMKEVLSSSFESPLIGIIRHLPNHQKTILVVALLLIGKRKGQSLRYSKLEAFYQFMAKKHILPKTSAREFNVVIDSLVTDNIVQIVAASSSSAGAAASAASRSKKAFSNDTKLQLMVSRDDLRFAFRDEPVLCKFFEMDMVIPPRFRDKK